MNLSVCVSAADGGRNGKKLMAHSSSHVPGFRPICLTIGALYVALASTMLVGGVGQMAQFGVPEATLASPHFADHHHWVFVHMAVIGVLIALLGHYVELEPSQRVVARVLCLIQLHYLYLDLRTSTLFGSGLYNGRAWVVPVTVGGLVLLAFLYLGFGKRRRRVRPAAA
jgi:hypothetical protein